MTSSSISRILLKPQLNFILSQWVYVRDDMSKGLKNMSLGVINHGIPLPSNGYIKSIKAVRRQRNLGLSRMPLSVQTNFEKTMFVQA
jgi:hypothetical protein